MAGQFNRVIACGVSILAAACGGGSPNAPSQPTSVTFLSLTSNPGDPIGQGFKQRAGLSDGTFSARVSELAGGRQGVNLDIQGNGNLPSWGWTIRLTMPPGQPLQPGTYDGARRWPGEAGQPGFELFGAGRSCDSTSRFVISEVAVGELAFIGRNLDRLRMTFEQRCDGATGSMTGEISIAANPWR
jgi:hypothetical protein